MTTLPRCSTQRASATSRWFGCCWSEARTQTPKLGVATLPCEWPHGTPRANKSTLTSCSCSKSPAPHDSRTRAWARICALLLVIVFAPVNWGVVWLNFNGVCKSSCGRKPLSNALQALLLILPTLFDHDNNQQEQTREQRTPDELLGSPGPFRARKHNLYGGGTHLPFIVSWPGRVAPRP